MPSLAKAACSLKWVRPRFPHPRPALRSLIQFKRSESLLGLRAEASRRNRGPAGKTRSPRRGPVCQPLARGRPVGSGVASTVQGFRRARGRVSHKPPPSRLRLRRPASAHIPRRRIVQVYQRSDLLDSPAEVLRAWSATTSGSEGHPPAIRPVGQSRPAQHEEGGARWLDD